MRPLYSFALLAGLLAPAQVRAADFTLTDGDRVVLLGNTLIERAQRHGYWETLLTRRYPDANITFRNLGWSGDTVFGDARAGFGSQADGFNQLRKRVEAAKPTVIFLGYGLNESFAGEAGLPHFLKGLDTLLDTLAPTARFVVLSPLRHEDLGRPLPDPAEHNRRLRLYIDALRKVAEKRGYPFVDFYDLLGDGARTAPPAPLTDNGIHLTAFGYWRAGLCLEKGLGLATPRWRVEIDAKTMEAGGAGAQVSRVQLQPLRFQVTDHVLPAPPPPRNAPESARPGFGERVLRVHGLAPGNYWLTIDGQRGVLAPAWVFDVGVNLRSGPDFVQVEKLRRLIVEKNRLYFYRWRPQNETYLFGFRRNEQGKNAAEVDEFDPLVVAREAEIARLRVPVAHQYQLVAVKEAGK